MNKFETLTYEELSAVFGGNGGKARRRRKITNCAKAIGMGALKDGLKYGIAGTAFGTPIGTPIGTVGGAIFGANVGIISGSVSCVSHL
ncbi:Blp family class II bacteriocin [Lactobacillus crispatus]|uniref:Blp family class II bacteriocin n=1 Tax=Lactobacillus crispatus TaxID=47770 RepID=UPI0021A7EEF5|nr:Blp family class II bacteriocin [Lactobacillus crispatus]